MSFLTLEQGKEIHALALLLGAYYWWTPDIDPSAEFNSVLDFGGFKEDTGFCNWYDFKDPKAATTFTDLIRKTYHYLKLELELEVHPTSATVYINWT